MTVESSAIATTHLNAAAPEMVRRNVVGGAPPILAPTKVGRDPEAPLMSGGGGSVIIHAGGDLVRAFEYEQPIFPWSPESQRAVQAARDAAARNEAAKAYTNTKD